MIKRELRRKTFPEWLKLALIPSLGLVLVLVLCWPTKKNAAVVESTSIASNDSNRIPAKQPKSKKLTWPTTRLEDVLAFNPFEPSPARVPDDVAAQSTDSADEDRTNEPLPQRSTIGALQAIYVDSQGAAAILDSKVIHVGDILPSGQRIVEITPQGIKLEGS